MSQLRGNGLASAGWWILLCTLLSSAGWILSALHALNPTGYAVVFAAALIAGLLWRRQLNLATWPRFSRSRFRRRFSRFFPAAFLVIAALATLGGVLNAPNNYDALAYRLPRVLNWLAEERWHWIHTWFPRLNTRACGSEWVSAPLMLLSRTHRLLFLINVFSFLLMPGLVFKVFVGLGVRRAVAWHWMWLLPSGYCYALQVGGIGNDLFGAVFALAALAFALEARRSGRLRDAILSTLAAALLTGAKTSNLPLLLPWALVLLPSLRLFLRNIPATAVTAGAALLVSFLPMAVLNQKYCGDWSGAALEAAGLRSMSPAITVPGNAILITLENFVPPIFPLADKWNAIAPTLLPSRFQQRMIECFWTPSARLQVVEMQNEEFAGVGSGIACLTVVSVVAGWLLRRQRATSADGSQPRMARLWLKLVRWSPFVSLLAYSAMAAMGGTGRIVTPYYALLLPALLARDSQTSVCRAKWWRALAALVFAVVAGLLILTPSRPLWPAQSVLAKLVAAHPENSKLRRAQNVFEVYGRRGDALAPVRESLPPEAKVVGLFSYDDPVAPLWLPFGQRRFVDLLPDDSREKLDQLGIRYVVVDGGTDGRGGLKFEQWLRNVRGRIVRQFPMRLRASGDAFDWYLVRLE